MNLNKNRYQDITIPRNIAENQIKSIINGRKPLKTHNYDA